MRIFLKFRGVLRGAARGRDATRGRDAAARVPHGHGLGAVPRPPVSLREARGRSVPGGRHSAGPAPRGRSGGRRRAPDRSVVPMTWDQ